MRPLTPAERRQIEEIKKDLQQSTSRLIMAIEMNRDAWLNICAIVLETDNVLREQWRGSVGNVVE